MVREMMDSESAIQTAGSNPGNNSQVANGVAGPEVQGHVVKGNKTTTYVGATHCMAMLEDVRILSRSRTSLVCTYNDTDRRSEELL